MSISLREAIVGQQTAVWLTGPDVFKKIMSERLKSWYVYDHWLRSHWWFFSKICEISFFLAYVWLYFILLWNSLLFITKRHQLQNVPNMSSICYWLAFGQEFVWSAYLLFISSLLSAPSTVLKNWFNIRSQNLTSDYSKSAKKCLDFLVSRTRPGFALGPWLTRCLRNRRYIYG